MSFTDRKQSANALKDGHKNEVTVTIQGKDKTNYHETFMLDTSLNHTFEFDGVTYNIPAEDTQHYHPSFWKFDVKLGMFFEKHKLIAKFLDWFKFREKATFEIGYLYEENNVNPLSLTPKIYNPQSKQYEDFITSHNFALINYDLMKNTTFEGKHQEVKNLYRKGGMSMKSIMAFLLIIIAIVAAVVVASMLFGNQPQPQTIQNVTTTIGAIHP